MLADSIIPVNEFTWEEIARLAVLNKAFDEVRHCEERSDKLRLRYFATARSEATSIKNIIN